MTQAADYMGPAIVALFREHGAIVTADETDFREEGAVERVVEKAGRIDVLVANLAAPANFGKTAVEMDDESWYQIFDIMVHPLHRLCRAILPAMYERRAGKIVVIGSGTGLKALEGVSAYGSARVSAGRIRRHDRM